MPIPELSVLLPVHDAEAYLAEALDSILGQTHTDFELIAVDDGSRDRSREVLAEYAARDRRVRILQQPPSGIVVALNYALSEARADILARMDADDVSLPQRFERQLDYMQRHPDCVLLGTRALAIDADGAPIIMIPTGDSHEDIDAQLLAGRGSVVVHPTVMMRKQAVARVGGYREPYAGAEDLDLFLRLAEIGRVENLPELLLRVRRSSNSASASVARQRTWEMRSAIVADARARRGLPRADLKAVQIWHPEGLGEHHLTIAIFALQGGHPRTALKHLRQLVARPRGIRNLASIVSFRLGPHVVNKYVRSWRRRRTE